ncbi:hypothetical protein, partial [Methanocrinis sp.]|uniref:hypothetical protein n=1 Tax=Methanocrinis sp. TaxID=3101522 RepID=UPI003D0D2586
MRSNFSGGKSEVEAERWWMEAACLLVLLCILAATISASAQVPESLVRGSFSDGNGSWNAESFGWFYYDLDAGVGGEELT